MSAKILGLVLLTNLHRYNADVGDICGYAPLCGTADTTFDWTDGEIPEGIEGDVILGAQLEFQDCCKLADTNPVEDCQIVDPTGESYRTITANDPICGDGGEDCTESCENYQLVIVPQFETSSTSDGCCDSCSCFGDPQCIPFSGADDMQTWVLCDGREIPNEDSMWDMCRITRNQCLQEKDHAGNQCVYLAEDKRGRDWVTGKQGSPCQPNPASPPSTILMYSVPSANFNLTLQQGDRGIITDVYLNIECGSFHLSADACLSDGKGAWDYTGVSSLPEFFSYNDVVYGYDQHWSVVDPDSGIAVAIRCHANHYDGDDTLYVPRINVEDVSDPAARGSNTDGFCVTGEFEFGKATTKNTKAIIKGDKCTEGLQDSDERDIYRAICQNPGLPTSGFESCIYHFCNANYAPLFSSVAECKETFDSSLAEGFCKAIVYTETDVSKCVAQWFDLGAVETITQYYDDRSGCTSQTSTTLDKCQSGVIVQYYRNGVWNDEIAIPSDFCGNEPIILSYCDHKYLFNRPIRILQKSANVQCGATSQCTAVEGFRGEVTLVKQTPYPTTFPTQLPTLSPSVSPTKFPVAPTPYPTTETPTPYPSPFPTTPVGNVPTDCPYTPLCDTETEYVNYENEDYEFHLDMGGCCPQECPGQDYEEVNRTQGTWNWFCGKHSDAANGTVDDSILGQNCEDQYELTIQVMFEHQESCCKKCTCYGDPRCYSFDGAFEEFILCDGRTAGDSSEDRCIIRRDTCLSQTDQSGNQCAWYNPKSTPPNYSDATKQWSAENDYAVSRYGSPCRYDPEASEIPMITMYDAENFLLEVEQGERGYIQSVTINVTAGTFSMDAERCLDGGSWEVKAGGRPSGMFKRQSYGKEYVWSIEDPETQIMARIRCTGHLYNNKYAITFINVEAIYEFDEQRMESASGFCATSEMSEKSLASTGHTEDLVAGGYCDEWNHDVTDIMKREVVRIITNNPGVTTLGTEAAYRTFCNSFFMPGWTSVGKCTSAFMDAKSVKQLISLFCTAATKESDACVENLEQINSETDDYKETFQVGYETYIVSYEMQCEVKFGDLPTSLTQSEDTCETGVELQFYNPRKAEWITYAAFPDNSPCSGYTVKALYDYHPKLFKNPLRLVQKHNFEACNKCTYASSVMGWFEFTLESS